MLKPLLAVLLLTPCPTLASAATPAAHIVRPGDTLSAIARQYHVTVGDLRRWNNLEADDVITPDAALRLSDSHRARPAWSTWSETLTAAEANGDPAKKCPVPATDLRRVWVKYTDFAGNTHDGSLIVSRTIVPATQKAFALLYKWRFPIMVMEPVARNLPGLTDRTVLTSGYECRNVAGTTKWSQHAYGLAIDVNPRQNPMIRGTYLDPPHSEPWIPRTPYRTGMIHPGGAETAFTTNGFAWGGRWKSLKDYMHFSPNNL
ncbi:M15 family metallopeptidase [Actinoplanes sp. L3-i22]|uniref:M15 family metallopeptidase n=1 Tax=Actinoplanes sp. L3-i22 TaxID=2836373 RepID=UPI002106D8E8|nr:M15 family metallopeptidase [Actinoplanes sp. L3-i22]